MIQLDITCDRSMEVTIVRRYPSSLKLLCMACRFSCEPLSWRNVTDIFKCLPQSHVERELREAMAELHVLRKAVGDINTYLGYGAESPGSLPPSP